MIHSVGLGRIILGGDLFRDSRAGLVVSLDICLPPAVFAAHGGEGDEAHQGEYEDPEPGGVGDAGLLVGFRQEDLPRRHGEHGV